MAERIIRDPEIMSGTPCFRGTRVPFQTLLDYLEAGETLDEFLEQFPGVTREMAIGALDCSKESLPATHRPLAVSFLAIFHSVNAQGVVSLLGEADAKVANAKTELRTSAPWSFFTLLVPVSAKR